MDELRKGAADRLMSALQQDEFVLYTQSIIPLTKADEHPFREIFIRLKEEDDKLLPPGTFFPILQEAGMLPTLDRWVVNRLARWVRTTLDAEPQAKIPRYNVNLSDETVEDPDFGEYVTKYVDESYLSEGVLGFEISRESATTNRKPLRRLMDELRPFGCGFALSGLDAGERSAALVKALEPDFVKISAATVNPLEVTKIQGICKGTGSLTIAEHVENGEVLEHLRRSKIDFAQGFAIAPVVPL